MTVYKLDHLHILDSKEAEEDWKFIGIYSSREKAEDAIERLRTQKGFRDFPKLLDMSAPDDESGFCISEITVDKETGWSEGFTTVYYS